MQQWVKTRQQLLSQIKSQVDELLGEEAIELRPLYQQYAREFDGDWQPSSSPEIIESMLATRLVLAGDFHAFAQSQRTHLRLLRSLPKQVSLVLVLECFQEEHQDILDKYVAGEVSENEFLNKIEWEEKWGFPWEHYRPLVHLARQKGFPLKAMNVEPLLGDIHSIPEREARAAFHVKKLREEYPDHIFFIMYGDLHLVSERFPTVLKQELAGDDIQLTRIFLNSEELYFDLTNKGLENQIEVMKKQENTFCILGSPPWVKWQSYLIYLEQTFDQDLEEEDEEDSMDFTDHVNSIVKLICKDFDLDISSNALSVSTPDEDVIGRLRLAQDETVELRLNHLIRSERSFIFPEQGVVYLSRFSINHAASVAGMYAHFQYMDAAKVNWEIEKCFESWVWIEAVAFFFSKWINPKRKPDSLQELKARLVSLDQKSMGRRPMILAMEQRMREVQYVSTGEISSSLSEGWDFEVFFDSSKVMGSILGEKLYLAVKSGKVPPQEFKEWMKLPAFGPEFNRSYYAIVKNIEAASPGTEI